MIFPRADFRLYRCLQAPTSNGEIDMHQAQSIRIANGFFAKALRAAIVFITGERVPARTTRDDSGSRSHSNLALRKIEHATRCITSPTVTYGIYEEDYWVARVLIVSDRSDSEFERCTLQVVEHVRNSASINAPKVGELFEYVWRRGVMCSGVGRLSRD
jgi:hypothetical protein